MTQETNSDVLIDVLDGIESASGVKAKREVMREEHDLLSEEQKLLFTNMLKYAYDRNIRFGISLNQISDPATQAPNPRDFGDWVFLLLEDVINASGTTAKKEMLEAKLGELNIHGRVLLKRIIDKDLRCGINESTINKVFPDLLTVFAVMLAQPFLSRRVPSWPMMVEPKLDGLRCIAECNVKSREVTFYTRSGKEITSLDLFKPEVIVFANQFEESGTVAFDCEVTSGSFLESTSSVRKSKEQVKEGTLHVFDVLVRQSQRSPLAWTDEELEGQGELRERRKHLAAGFKKFKDHVGGKPQFVQVTDSYLVSSEEEVFVYYNRCRDAGLEGVIVKDPNSFYVKKRSAAWLKIKAEETLDLPIVGAFEGTGQFAGALGGFIVDNEGVEVRVGSGFTAEQRREFWDVITEDTILVERGERESCQLIDCPVEIQFQEKLPSGSLRHPVFVRLRKDKRNGVAGAF